MSWSRAPPGQGHRRTRRKPVEQHQRVHPDIAFGVVLRRLRHPFHLDHFRQHLGQQPGRIQHFEGATRVALGEHAGQFVAHPLVAHLVDGRR